MISFKINIMSKVLAPCEHCECLLPGIRKHKIKCFEKIYPYYIPKVYKHTSSCHEYARKTLIDTNLLKYSRGKIIFSCTRDLYHEFVIHDSCVETYMSTYTTGLFECSEHNCSVLRIIHINSKAETAVIKTLDTQLICGYLSPHIFETIMYLNSVDNFPDKFKQYKKLMSLEQGKHMYTRCIICGIRDINVIPVIIKCNNIGHEYYPSSKFHAHSACINTWYVYTQSCFLCCNIMERSSFVINNTLLINQEDSSCNNINTVVLNRSYHTCLIFHHACVISPNIQKDINNFLIRSKDLYSQDICCICLENKKVNLYDCIRGCITLVCDICIITWRKQNETKCIICRYDNFIPCIKEE